MYKKYRVQFNNALNAKIGLAKYNCAQPQNNNWGNELDILLFIDLLWSCAISLTDESNHATNHMIIYDNLDIIENHQIVANFIDTLRSVLSNYTSFKLQIASTLTLPKFKVILTVRKITYASISRFVEIGNNESSQTLPDIDFIDISNLYIPSNVLKHKAVVIQKAIDDYIPIYASCRGAINSFLSEVIKTPDEIFDNIKFSDLLNHNIRACANMMEKVITSQYYQEYVDLESSSTSKISGKCRTALWIHCISTVLRDTQVLNNLGYNLSDTEDINYPTTLSRLILTLLGNRRLGYMHGYQGFTSSDVSFIDIVQEFEKIPFNSVKRQTEWGDHIAKILIDNFNIADNRTKIVSAISRMLQRNDSAEDTELWRRPIYYTHNAFSLSNAALIQKALNDQLSSPKSQITYFCIADEGYTFIDKIAPHFEFYSVRYYNRISKPICCIMDKDNLDAQIGRVFTQIEQCVIKQLWLMDFYINTYQITKNEYLNKQFHPRTIEHAPQLHVVRAIYDHIDYLNDYRDYLLTSQKDHPLTPQLNVCLISWIGRYLDLYRNRLFNVLANSSGAYNNNIWLDLKYLYWLVYKDEKKKGVNFLPKNKSSFITINRKSAISRQKQANNEYRDNRISDEKLKAEPMLL